MDLVSFIILCVVVGVLVWAVTAYIPMPAPIKNLIIVAAVIVLVLVFLRALGLLDANIPIPRLR